jgi:hypothetical protein
VPDRVVAQAPSDTPEPVAIGAAKVRTRFVLSSRIDVLVPALKASRSWQSRWLTLCLIRHLRLFQIEIKLGLLLDKATDRRLKLPVITECS